MSNGRGSLFLQIFCFEPIRKNDCVLDRSICLLSNGILSPRGMSRFFAAFRALGSGIHDVDIAKVRRMFGSLSRIS